MRLKIQESSGMLVCLLMTLGAASAQQPRLSNAQLQARSAASGLHAEFRAAVGSRAEPVWIGYAVAIIPGEHNMCCYYGPRGGSDCCTGCQLESGRSGGVQALRSEPIRLEGPRHLLVLFRAEAGAVQKIRVFTEDCPLDVGGLPFYWLTDVRAADSVSLLSEYATSAGKDVREAKKISDAVVAAIAMHNDPAADQDLEGFVASGQPESLRERTTFWLGNARGRRGYEALRKLLREDSSTKVRDKAVFALTQSREPDALTLLIETAKNDSNSRVRGQALFWLAQKAGREAMEAITSAIESDPETEVKKKAVFALSQLPKDEGVPKLIEVARTNRNPEVRKQAMFWLGQSNDPRALSFFEEILKK